MRTFLAVLLALIMWRLLPVIGAIIIVVSLVVFGSK
jgi:hypothetical protein